MIFKFYISTMLKLYIPFKETFKKQVYGADTKKLHRYRRISIRKEGTNWQRKLESSKWCSAENSQSRLIHRQAGREGVISNSFLRSLEERNVYVGCVQFGGDRRRGGNFLSSFKYLKIEGSSIWNEWQKYELILQMYLLNHHEDKYEKWVNIIAFFSIFLPIVHG